MAATRKTSSTFQTLFETQNQIDFAQSVVDQVGMIFSNTVKTCLIAATNTWTRAANTTTAGGTGSGWTEAVTNRLTYTGATTCNVIFNYDAIVKMASSSAVISAGVVKTLTTIIANSVRKLSKLQGTYVPIRGCGIVKMSTNMNLSLAFQNNTNTTHIMVYSMGLQANALFT